MVNEHARACDSTHSHGPLGCRYAGCVCEVEVRKTGYIPEGGVWTTEEAAEALRWAEVEGPIYRAERTVAALALMGEELARRSVLGRNAVHELECQDGETGEESMHSDTCSDYTATIRRASALLAAVKGEK